MDNTGSASPRLRQWIDAFLDRNLRLEERESAEACILGWMEGHGVEHFDDTQTGLRLRWQRTRVRRGEDDHPSPGVVISLLQQALHRHHVHPAIAERVAGDVALGLEQERETRGYDYHDSIACAPIGEEEEEVSPPAPAPSVFV